MSRRRTGIVLGIVCQGAGENACLIGLASGQVSVTVSGPGEAMAGLSAAQLTPIVDAGGLAPGTYTLSLAIGGLPDGVELGWASIGGGRGSVSYGAVDPPGTRGSVAAQHRESLESFDDW